MGNVYLAEHPGLQRRSAIKVLRPELCTDTQLVSRFFTEARAANAIRHPAIVEIYDYGTLTGGAPYITMEYLSGETLAERLRRQPLTMAEALDIAGQIGEGLTAAHRANVIHRDLKPENLFLVDDPANGRVKVKILDFGIAKLQNTFGGMSHKTRTGALMGTPTYMSPEQCRGLREADHRVDIYALGLIVYEMLCGRPPFVSEGVGELVNLHINAPPTPPRQFNASVSGSLQDLLLRALQKDPDARFATMSQMVEALRAEQTLVGQVGVMGVGSTLLGAGAAPPAPAKMRPLPTTLSGRAAEMHQITVPVRRSGRAMPLIITGVVLFGLGGTAAWKFSSGGPTKAALNPPARAEPVAEPKPPSPAIPEVNDVKVELNSEPPGATVQLDGVVIATTPATVRLPATKTPVDLVFALHGFVSTSIKALPSDGLRLNAQLSAVPHAPPVATARPRRLPATHVLQPAPVPKRIVTPDEDIKFAR